MPRKYTIIIAVVISLWKETRTEPSSPYGSGLAIYRQSWASLAPPTDG